LAQAALTAATGAGAHTVFLLFFEFERKNLSNSKNNKKVQLLRNV